jgi:hypothetical protein
MRDAFDYILDLKLQFKFNAISTIKNTTIIYSIKK